MDFLSSRITRRSLMISGAAAATTLSMSRARALSGEVVVADYGGVTTEMSRKAFYAPFTEATSVAVREATMTGFAQIKAMVLAGNVEWDLASTEEQNIYIGAKSGLLEP